MPARHPSSEPPDDSDVAVPRDEPGDDATGDDDGDDLALDQMPAEELEVLFLKARAAA